MSLESVNQMNNLCNNSPRQEKMMASQICATTKINPSLEVEHPNLMDTSFQNNLSQEHSQAIWKASIQFLKNSLKVRFDESKGFNDSNIMESHMEIKEQLNEQTSIFEIIQKNQVLICNSLANNFILALHHSRHLRQLLINLYELFPQQVFQEILILLCQSWQQYQLYKQTTLLNEKFAKFLSPSFVDLDTAELKNQMPQKIYIKQKQEQITQKAYDAAHDIAGSYFISTKISHINLRKIDYCISNSNAVRTEFQKFVKTITKSLFLCAEGCFKNSSQNEQIDFFDQAWFSERSLDQQSDNKNGRKRRNI